jgi:hypothetical protein
MEESGSCLIKVLSHLPGETEENKEDLSQDFRSLGRDLNPEPPEYEAGLLTIRPLRLIIKMLLSIGIIMDIYSYAHKTDCRCLVSTLESEIRRELRSGKYVRLYICYKNTEISRLGGVVVSVLATGPKGCGFKTRLRRWIFKGDKNPQHIFLSDGK